MAPASADPTPGDSLPTTARLAEAAPFSLLGEPPIARSAGAPADQTPDGSGGTSFLSADPYAQQQLSDQATLETRRPEVQWSPASSTDWTGVPARQTVSTGDRIRTGAGASARLTYFEGSVTEIGPETGLLVQRLERTANGNIVTNLFQSVGTTVNRVVQLVDPSGGFSVETPAATAFVRGTMPKVDVARNGVTRFSNIPDDTNGLVDVVGKDPNQSQVTLPPGTFTDVTPGQPPTTPASLTSLAGAETLDGGGANANNLIQQRQQQRQQQQQLAQQQLAQSQGALAAGQAASNQFAAQEQALVQQINSLLVATPSPTPTIKPAASVTPSPTPRPGGPSPTPRPLGTSTATPLALPTLATGQLRMVLTWGATPRDLDSHLWVPVGGVPAAAAPGADPLANDTLRLLRLLDGSSPSSGADSVLGQVSTLTPTATPTRTVTATRTPTIGPAPTPPASGTPGVPCTTSIGGGCAITGVVTGRYTKSGAGGQVVANVAAAPAGALPNAVPTIFIPTTANPNGEAFPCQPPALASGGTFCLVNTAGDVLQGATVTVDFPLAGGGFGNVTGIIAGSGPATPTATPGGQFTEVYFASRGSATSPPFATLDIDVTSGFGPETITIERLLPGQYTYAVHNFSNEAPLSASGAQVQVFSPTGVVATFSVPAGSGRWWTVFTLDGTTGAITPVNTIGSSPPLPSAIGP
jgi:hypothetical protein